MKRIILSMALAMLLSVCPVTAHATASSAPPKSEEEPFFTSSEAEALDGRKEGMHPIVWVFAAGGVGALAVIAVIINMGKQQKQRQTID